MGPPTWDVPDSVSWTPKSEYLGRLSLDPDLAKPPGLRRMTPSACRSGARQDPVSFIAGENRELITRHRVAFPRHCAWAPNTLFSQCSKTSARAWCRTISYFLTFFLSSSPDGLNRFTQYARTDSHHAWMPHCRPTDISPKTLRPRASLHGEPQSAVLSRNMQGSYPHDRGVSPKPKTS